jgi:hypothetical protein
MFAIDTSSLIAYFNGDIGKDVELITKLIPINAIILPPPVVVEALSNKKTRALVEPTLKQLIMIEIKESFWYRASILRAEVLSSGLKANIADTLIAQSCIDHDIPLITRDADFRHFVKFGGLKLAV